jgi:hypothetical protein
MFRSIFSALLLGACTAPGTTPAPPAALVALEDATEAECPGGGVAILTGIDTDGDAVLDETEVEDRRAVCSGLSGSDGSNTTGTVLAVEPATTVECPESGIVVLVGEDTDGDGSLSAGEVVDRVPVCDGEEGAAGTPGQGGADGGTTLVRIDPAGPLDCPNGGIIVVVGLDADGDGVLGSTEGTTREAVCDGADGQDGQNGTGGRAVHHGHVSIASTADFARLAGVERIVGDLAIHCLGEPMPDLLPLATLREVTNVVSVQSCTQLTTLSGLDGLTTIGGSFVARDLPDLVSLEGLGALESIGGGLSLEDLDALVDLRGLGALGFVGSNLTVTLTDSLVTLDGLGPVAEVDRLILTTNLALADLDGLEALRVARGGVDLRANRVLASVAGLGGLESVGEDLTLYDLPALTHLDGFDSLALVGADLIVELTGLEDVAGFAALTEVEGALAVQTNRSLTDLGGFGALTHVGGFFRVTNNAALVDGAGFTSLASVGGTLYVSDNPALRSLGSFTSLSQIADNLDLRNNDDLPDLDAFGALRTVGEDITIEGHAELVSIAGLHGLTTLGDDMFVDRNPCLPSSARTAFVAATGINPVSWQSNGTTVCP